MADTSSFDITSPVDFAEVENALNQSRKEIGQRYDFKGVTADITLDTKEKTLTLLTDDEMKMNAVWEIVLAKLVKRSVPLKGLSYGVVTPAGGSTVRQEITLQQGIAIEKARDIVKTIKD